MTMTIRKLFLNKPALILIYLTDKILGMFGLKIAVGLKAGLWLA
jgi:hypothetical protein